MVLTLSLHPFKFKMYFCAEGEERCTVTKWRSYNQLPLYFCNVKLRINVARIEKDNLECNIKGEKMCDLIVKGISEAREKVALILAYMPQKGSAGEITVIFPVTIIQQLESTSAGSDKQPQFQEEDER